MVHSNQFELMVDGWFHKVYTFNQLDLDWWMISHGSLELNSLNWIDKWLHINLRCKNKG
jgi:hypothetical protein